MACIRHAAIVAIAVFSFLLAGLPLLANAQESFRVREIAAEAFAPYSEIPRSISLRGIVVDEDGKPLPGAELRVAGRVARSGTDGRFVIPGKVSAVETIEISHRDAVTLTRPARAFFSGENGQSEIVLPRYTETFTISPRGGRYRGREMTLEVPSGAVSRNVTIRAAQLPPDLAYDARPGVQMRRIAAVALEPGGLKFAKPVRLRVPNIYDPGKMQEGVPLIFDRETERYRQAPDAVVERDGDHTIFTIRHFSQYASGNPAEGIQRQLIKNTPDLNGDRVITTQDAEFVVILSGGDHGAQWVKSTGSASAVMRTASTSATQSNTKTKGASGGVSFGGIGVEVSGEVSNTEAREASSAVGSGASSGETRALEFSLAAPEYDTECRYVLRWYDYWRVRKWVKIEPSDKEVGALQRSYNKRPDQDDEWGYFVIAGHTGVTVGGTVRDGDRVAVRKTTAGWEYYRVQAEHIVRETKGVHILNCDAGSPHDKIARSGNRDDARFFGGGDGMDDAAFDGSTTIRYLGWGTLPNTRPDRITGMECGNEASEEITITTETEESSEQASSVSSNESSSVSAEGKIEIPAFGAVVGGGVSASQSSETARSRSSSYAKTYTNQVSTTVRWEVNDPHKPTKVHESDHDLHKLFLRLEARSWHLVDPDKLSRDVRRAFGKGDKRSYVGEPGGDMIMRDADNSYLIAGPPVLRQKEIGFMLVRVAERPCPGTPRQVSEQAAPESAPARPARQDATIPSHQGQGTAPRDTRPPEITPGPGEYKEPEQSSQSVVYTPRGNMENYTAVPFTALDGETVVRRREIGEVQSVTFIAVDGKRLEDQEKKAKVREGRDSIRIDAGRAIDVASILIGGTAGSVELFIPGGNKSSGSSVGLVGASDGTLEVKNGAINEAIRVPDRTTDVAAGPDRHQVMINGAAVETVALREGELSVVGTNVPPPSDARSTISVTGPDGRTVEGSSASWGYDVSVQPVTRVGQTVPVRLQLHGLTKRDAVQVEFMPGPGQTIEPRQVVMIGEQASAMQPVASLTAQVPGTQQLNVRVSKAPSTK